MATVNLGRIKPVFRGAFNNSTAYVIDDIVTSGNETFIAIAATQGNATTDASKWTKLAAKGADGTDVAATLQNKEIAFKTNAGALDGIPIGSAGEFLKVNSGATGYEFGAVAPAGWIKHTYFSNNTRTTQSDVNHRVMFSIAFTKSESSSIILVQGIIPVSQEQSDNIGQYGAMDTGGSEPANDGVHHTGVLFIPTNSGTHPGGFIYNQRFTGLSAGSHTFYAGYNPRNDAGNAPGVLNYNNSENGRNQQSGTTFIIQEVSA